MPASVARAVRGIVASYHRIAPTSNISDVPFSCPIELVRKGDLVLSADPEEGVAASPRRVTATIKDWTPCLVHIGFGRPDGSLSASDLVLTRLHPVWTKQRKWQHAANLQRGDLLQDDNGKGVRVLGYRQVWGKSDTYNLTVTGLHTFFVIVGGTPILVHNAVVPPFPPDPQAIPPDIYRSGGTNPANLTPRPSDDGILSFRSSLTNPIDTVNGGPFGGRPVFPPGKPYFTIDTSKLPLGSVIPDNVPPGHVGVQNVPPDVLQKAVSGKFPSL